MKKKIIFVLLLLALLLVFVYAGTNCILETSVTPSGSGTVTPANGTYDKGTELWLIAQPASGFRFDHWSGDVTGTSIATTILMNSNKNLVAHFVAQHTIETTITPSGSGNVSPANGFYDKDTELILTAYPAPGFRFDHWSGDVTGTSISTTILMNSNKNLVAHFVEEWTLIQSDVYSWLRLVAEAEGFLKIKNELEWHALVVLCESDEPKIPYDYVVVKKNNSGTISYIEDGKYILYYTLGMGWDNESHKFTITKAYMRFEEELEFVTTAHSYTTNTVTLYTVSDETANKIAKTVSISEADFPFP